MCESSFIRYICLLLNERNAVEYTKREFANFKEVNLFLRGMIPLVGFSSTSVYYERHERLAGESHYPLSKMLALAFNGITSLSIKPIRIITGLGLVVSLLSFIGVIWAVVSRLTGNTTDGWASGFSRSGNKREKAAPNGAASFSVTGPLRGSGPLPFLSAWDRSEGYPPALHPAGVCATPRGTADSSPPSYAFTSE